MRKPRGAGSLVVFTGWVPLATIHRMKSPGVLLLATILASVLAACASSPGADAAAQANKQMEAKGSPFRYQAQDTGNGAVLVLTLLPLPAGPTKANPTLAKQVLALLSKEEAKKGRYSAELEEVRYLNEGREVWVLHSIGDGIAYIVAMSNPSAVNSSIKITGPTKYLK
jgi:hypothetical protein